MYIGSRNILHFSSRELMMFHMKQSVHIETDDVYSSMLCNVLGLVIMAVSLMLLSQFQYICGVEHVVKISLHNTNVWFMRSNLNLTCEMLPQWLMWSCLFAGCGCDVVPRSLSSI